MANIPVGQKIPITDYIPLPLSRPVMEENIPGGVLAQFKLDIPFNPAEVDLTFPVVGMNWIRQPLDWLSRHNPFSFGWSEDRHGWYNLNIYNFESEALLWLGALGLVSLVLTGIILGTEKLLEKFNIISRDR